MKNVRVHLGDYDEGRNRVKQVDFEDNQAFDDDNGGVYEDEENDQDEYNRLPSTSHQPKPPLAREHSQAQQERWNPGSYENFDMQAAWDARRKREQMEGAMDERMTPADFRRHQGARFVRTSGGNWVRTRTSEGKSGKQKKHGWNAKRTTSANRNKRGKGQSEGKEGMMGMSVSGHGYAKKRVGREFNALKRQQRQLVDVMEGCGW